MPFEENCLHDMRNFEVEFGIAHKLSLSLVHCFKQLSLKHKPLVLISFFLQYVPQNLVIIINSKGCVDCLFIVPTLTYHIWINCIQFLQDSTDNQRMTLVSMSPSTCRVFGIVPWCVSVLINTVCFCQGCVCQLCHFSHLFARRSCCCWVSSFPWLTDQSFLMSCDRMPNQG